MLVNNHNLSHSGNIIKIDIKKNMRKINRVKYTLYHIYDKKFLLPNQ